MIKAKQKRSTVSTKKLEQEIKILGERVEELQCTADNHASKLSLMEEILLVMREFPIGRSFINRAINRSKLRYLSQVVIPRRQDALLKIQLDKSMPEGIRRKFTDDQLKLIIQSQRALHHRKFFEQRSTIKVKNILMRLQNFLTNHKQRRIENAGVK